MSAVTGATPVTEPVWPLPGRASVPAVRTPDAAGDPCAAGDLCTDVLATLRRSDQRRKGERYVHGLLHTPGRKTIRNIAAWIGEHAGEQSLHHFISSSTWDWSLLRARLARRLEQELAPRAWVVRPMVVPKAGTQSVGVERRYVPHLRQTVNSQHSWGLWYASESGAVPVNWQLSIGDGWLGDEGLRRRAAIPRELRARPSEAVAAGIVGETAGWGLPRKPLVMDARELPVASLIRALSAAGQPFMLRIDNGTTLLAPGLSGAGRPVTATAARIAELARSQQRPVEWVDPAEPAVPRTSLLALLPVCWPGLLPVPGTVARPGGAAGNGTRRPPARSLVLVAEWQPDRSRVVELWVTNMTDAGRGTLLRLGKFLRRVETGSAGAGHDVGLRDFEGRSYPGWHRHVTLASLAHAMWVLAAPDIPAAGGRRATA
ncbi:MULTISPECIES: IS701 family transposase [Streptomyces]|uniref:Transposase n=3 Tax=Streptomyces TaxID=1883 RepID=A0A3M8EZM2_9ACTN|nr:MULTISPECIES: transposase [Streptomyces]AAF29380.1 TylR [Streptomyces fradiae]KNE79403.1 hypothetical protein ADZ36_27710 [Streptomyces fradiae]OFA37332.1 hypothetical protein BEN35_29185 [Streptomyces fradiae]PQM21367.1 hypothetical protein Sfr7A_22975 [Streptomyces xinghaiensis]RKM93735.1 transposase [Streptomyces xinghaiensis]